jgi:hypothetical protein
MGMSADGGSRTRHAPTLDEDTAEGVGFHTGHVDALMRGEFRAGRGRGFAEGQEDSRAEWPVAWDRGWRAGAHEGEAHVIQTVGDTLGKIQEDLRAACRGFKGNDKATRAQMLAELEHTLEHVGKLGGQLHELAEGLTDR